VTAEFRRPRAHALWAAPASGEVGAPLHRVIHAFHAGLGLPADARIGVRAARGYRQCGSRDETDWIRDVRISTWDGTTWHDAFEQRDIPRTAGEEVRWLAADLPGVHGLRVEVRRSWIDDWWPSWNLVSRGIELETAWRDPPLEDRPATPLPSTVDLGGLPAGVSARVRGGEIRYRTRVLEVGFRLGRPAMSFLAFDPDGLTDAPRDLLRHATLFEGDGNDWITNHPLLGQFALGPQLVTPDGISHIGQFAAVRDGEVHVSGPTVTYVLELPSLGQRHELRWTVGPTDLQLDVVREAVMPTTAVESSAWHLGFDARVTPPSLIGRPVKSGETGATRPPAILHAPGHGSLRITATGDVALRFEAARPLMTTGLDIKLGEEAGPAGDHVLPAGRAEASVRFEVTHGNVPALAPGAPPNVAAGVRRAWLTGLTYRLDTAVLSNNGNSIYVAATTDELAALARAIGPVDGEIHALDLVRDTIERYLDGGPGYMAGRTSFHDGLVQDEYIQTDVSVLLAIAHLLAGRPDAAWLAERAAGIELLLDRTLARDVDGDGLIESTLRRGITGERDWSSNTCDIVSFGWKDAYSNALLFEALTRLDGVLIGDAWSSRRDSLRAWADRLRTAYAPAFWNPATGWVAGWRSADDQLHDAGYLWVNGAAVTAGVLSAERARSAIGGLWNAVGAAGFSDLTLGLPLNALSIPRGDMIERYAGMPYGYAMTHGFYMNGSASLTLLRPFIAALRSVGMDDEADAVIDGALSSLADGSGFGGCTTGEDLHTWDGTPCGYEGILTYQFGVMASALERYGAGG
jgi:hypothetical protein